MLNDLSKALQITTVWEKARIIPGYDANKYRQDSYGAWISRGEYGNRSSDFGWEIDHITPLSKGGNDLLLNLQPLHWMNNAMKSDGVLSVYNTVRAVGNSNTFPK